MIVPAFFVVGIALEAGFLRLQIDELTSLIVTFGLTVILESLIQWIWTADFRRLESPYMRTSLKLGTFYIGLGGLLAFVAAAALTFATWAWLRWSYLGKAARASAQDGPMASAFGVNRRRLALLLAGLIGGIHAMFVTYVTVAETFAVGLAVDAIMMAPWAAPGSGTARRSAPSSSPRSPSRSPAGRARS